MKKLYFFLLFLTGMMGVFGQNAIVGPGFSTGWGGACNQDNDFEYFAPSFGGSYIKEEIPNGTGAQYFRMAIKFDGATYQVTKTIGADLSVSPNIEHQLNMNCTISGSMTINVPNTSYRYVFKTKGAGSNPEGKFLFFEIQGAVQTVSSVTHSTVSCLSGNINPVTVTANLSSGFATGQAAYLRYSTNNFDTSTVVKMSGSGTIYSADIPAVSIGSTVQYYVFTSGDGSLNTANGPQSNGSDADFRTINLSNNSESNYSYTAPIGSATISSAVGTDNQTLLNDATPITEIEYTLSNISGTPVSSGLPAGIVGSLSGNKYVLNGTPTTPGVYNYTINFTPTCGNAFTKTGTIKVNSNVVEYANIQYPKKPMFTLANGSFDIYTQVKLTGVTDNPALNGNGINVWIGYSTVNAAPATSATDFESSNWKWIPAEFNTGYTAAALGDIYNPERDEFKVLNLAQKAALAGKPLMPGEKYYYVSRAQRHGSSEYTYGGIDGNTSNTSGGIWNGSTFYSNEFETQTEIVWDSDNKWKYWDPYANQYIADADPLNNIPDEEIVPDILLNARILSDYDATRPSFTTKKLTIENGVSVTIGSGKFISVVDQIINLNGDDSPETFVVQSDANLIQINPVANTSKIKVERGVTDLNNVIGTNIDYVYWSSPVAGQNLQAFSPGTVRNRIYEYRESNDYFYEAPESNFIGGKGYAIRAETTGVTSGTYDKTYSFLGIPNNGDVDYQIKRSPNTGTGGSVVHGYNLVGNPYPSNIDFDVLYQNNADKIYNTAWFWQTNSILLTQTGNGYVGNNYVIYNGTGGNNAANNNGSAILAPPDGIIKTGQGFLVQKKDPGTAQLNFKNSYGTGQNLRVADAGTFYQKGNSKPAKNRFWLKLVSPENVSNTQLIGYIHGATNGYEKDFDAEAFSLSSDLFYSVLGDKRLVIQGKAEQFLQQDRVALGTNFFSNGNYTISLENPEGLFANEQSIYLKDKHTGIITNLSQASYTFATSAGETNARFEIMYQPEAVLGTGTTGKEQLVVYRENGDFVIRSPKQMQTVEVYDASGKLMRTLKTNTRLLTVETSSLIHGMYLLKIQMNDGSMVTKKVIR